MRFTVGFRLMNSLRAASTAGIALVLSVLLRAAEPVNLFAFDDHALPYKNNLKLAYVAPEKHPGNPVLAPGPAGSVDAVSAVFYGSVLRQGGKFRMWYRANSDHNVV